MMCWWLSPDIHLNRPATGTLADLRTQRQLSKQSQAQSYKLPPVKGLPKMHGSQRPGGNARLGKGKRDPRVRMGQTSYLPSIADNDFESDDQNCIEQIRHAYPYQLSKPSGGWRQNFSSAPDLHARHDGRMPSLGQQSTSSSPHNLNKHSSLPSLAGSPTHAKGRNSFDGDPSGPSIDLGADLRSAFGASVSGLHERDEAIRNPLGENASKPQSRGASKDRSVDHCGPSEGSPQVLHQRPQEMDGWGRAVPELWVIAQKWGIPFHDLKVSRELFTE